MNRLSNKLSSFVKPNYVRWNSSSSVIKNAKTELKSAYDVVVVGGGHNGLISAAYLQKEGCSVCVLEKRDVIGGAAVTEEIVPGFQFSRASYVLSLLRPFIISDLKLKEFGLKFYMREPFSSYTPIKESSWSKFKAKSLLLGSDMKSTQAEIAKFSAKDAAQYEKYEEQMGRFVKAVNALLDNRPPHFTHSGSRLSKLKAMSPLLKAARALHLRDIPKFHEILTASAAKILDSWFESEPLKATLATDALIGTYSGPHCLGTGYVLLHHIMGGIDDKPGAWAYVEGGMGGVTKALASSASQLGADIFCGQEVDKIEYKDGQSVGVVMKDGRQIQAKKAVLSNATPHVTFKKLTSDADSQKVFGTEFMNAVNRIDYTSPVTKINIAVNQLPNFKADPNSTRSPSEVQSHHKCTIHLNCETMDDLDKSFQNSFRKQIPSEKPMIELVIPSSLDPTISPKGAHVCLLFTQYTPFAPSDGKWDDAAYKEKYANAVINVVEEYAPGFKQSIVGKEVLSPFDLENIFGLTGGNIFHGAMTVDQLYWLRPFQTEACWFPSTPAKGLYLCGSGSHPGGGVMGLPGYFAYLAVKDTLI